jgi:uncharacterized membrane protein YgdD (TMEM256/DUF423 family)
MSMPNKFILLAGPLLAATGVMLGAFGAHALGDALGAERLGWWQTAVEYQMWHAVGLIVLAAVPMPRLGLPALLIGLGTLVFSGTLYLMALTDMRWLGAITPVGGILMIAGWFLLAWRAWRDRASV